MTRRRGTMAALALALLVPSACADDGPAVGGARLDVDGHAEVERANGEVDAVDGHTDVGPGDRVTMLEGVARMRLRGGTELELREGLGNAANTSVLMGRRPDLEAGDLLVSTADSIGLEVDGTEVQVTSGAARLTRAFGMSVAAYDADVALDSAGVSAEVPALRQMAVPDLGRPPQRPRPFDYNADDTWDRRYLGAAVDLGVRLEDIADGLTDFLPDGEGRTPGFFRLVLPGLADETSFGAALLESQLDEGPGELLVGAAIADLGKQGDFASRWSEVFEFRDQGAQWGIVALDQAVRSEPLVGVVEHALNSSYQEAIGVLDPSNGPGGPPSTSPTTSPTNTTTPGTPPTTSPTPTPTTTPTTTPGTPPTTTPEPPDGLDPIVEPATGLVDDLVGGLLG